MISMVFFDLDGTLVFHEPDSYEVVTAFCAEIGQPVSDEAWRRGRRARHEYFVDPEIRAQLGELSREEFWHRYNLHMLTVLGIQGDLDAIADVIGSRFAALDIAYLCPEAGLRTLTALRARGYQLGLITNREDQARFEEQLDQLGLRGHFDLLLTAGEAGVSKPNPAIFGLALARAGLTADQALYVGDNYWADVVGAERAGMRAVLLDPHHLFPEAECVVVERIEDLLAWLA